jgi:hypothetical protein
MQTISPCLAIAMAGGTLGCSVQELPPPAAPAQIVPHLASPPPPVGSDHGTVVIDTDTPAAVDEIIGHVESRYAGSVTRPLCTITPCAVSLGFGMHELRFSVPGAPTGTLGGDGTVEVGTRPVAYRYALGDPDPDHNLREGGGTAMLLGLIALPIGAALAKAGDESSSSTENHAGIGLAVSGLVAVVIGAAMFGQLHRRRGTGTQWVLQ